jgi:exodeoxyribonuclease VII large subunit
LRKLLAAYHAQLSTSIFNLIAEKRLLLNEFVARLKYVSPERSIQAEYQRVDELSRRAFSTIAHRLELQSQNVDGISKRLQALNPEAILSRGYAIVTRNEDGAVVSKVEQAQGKMKVRVSDGEFEVSGNS